MEPFRPLSATDRTTLGRLRERGLTDRSALYEVLDAALICHIGVVIDGTPMVLPTGYGRVGETLYLHGSSANKSLTTAAGTEICVTVTLLDGLVCARSVFHNSMNYRSAVIYGTARHVTAEAERLAALHAITDHLIPGRWANSRLPTRKELAATRGGGGRRAARARPHRRRPRPPPSPPAGPAPLPHLPPAPPPRLARVL